MFSIFTRILFILLVASAPAFSDINPTAQGRWSVGGSASLPIMYNKFREWSFNYSIRPEVSYFVLDGWEISFGATITNLLERGFTTTPQLSPPSNVYWGVKVGTAYYYPLSSSFQPYIGLDLGTLMANWEYKQLVWYLRMPIGVAWFVNPNVALTFGTNLSVDFSSTAIFENFTIDPGFLGVKILFD